VVETPHPQAGALRLLANRCAFRPLRSRLPGTPLLGQHTREVLAERLHFSAEQIAEWRRHGGLTLHLLSLQEFPNEQPRPSFSVPVDASRRAAPRRTRAAVRRVRARIEMQVLQVDIPSGLG